MLVIAILCFRRTKRTIIAFWTSYSSMSLIPKMVLVNNKTCWQNYYVQPLKPQRQQYSSVICVYCSSRSACVSLQSDLRATMSAYKSMNHYRTDKRTVRVTLRSDCADAHLIWSGLVLKLIWNYTVRINCWDIFQRFCMFVEISCPK